MGSWNSFIGLHGIILKSPNSRKKFKK